MLTLKKIAVTGAVSSGKSSVCRILEELGAYTASADAIVHGLLSPNTVCGQKVIELLGSDVVQNNSINRQIVARKVFKNPSLLKQLEAILHPEVFQSIENEYQTACTTSGKTSFVAEVPLLFETGFERWFDTVISVDAPESERLKRFLIAGGTQDDFYQRSLNQLSGEEKLKLAPYHLKNYGDYDSLRTATAALYKHLI